MSFPIFVCIQPCPSPPKVLNEAQHWPHDSVWDTHVETKWFLLMSPDISLYWLVMNSIFVPETYDVIKKQ